MRSALLLGGTGFVGSALRAGLTGAGWRVTTVGRRAADSCLDLAGADERTLARVVDGAGADVVINAAGAVWASSPADMQALNVELVARLAAVLRHRRTPLVQLGTVHEYGAAEAGHPLTEDTGTAPLGVYGRTKLAATGLLLGSGLPVAVLRVSNVVGPGAPAASLFGLVADTLAAGRGGADPVPLVLAPLSSERDYVAGDDVAAAVIATATHLLAGNTAPLLVNVAAGVSRPTRDLVQRLIAISGVATRLVERSPASNGSPGGAADRQQVEISRAARVLGWAPQHDVDDALARLWAERAADPLGRG